MGEVTSSSAIILLEVKFSNNTGSETQRRRVTIKCELFKKGESEPFTDPLEKEFPSRSPQVRIQWRRCLLSLLIQRLSILLIWILTQSMWLFFMVSTLRRLGRCLPCSRLRRKRLTSSPSWHSAVTDQTGCCWAKLIPGIKWLLKLTTLMSYFTLEIRYLSIEECGF